MLRPRWILLTLAAALTGICWLWRVRSWPCPSWLVPLLENPYFQAVAGAERLLDRAGARSGMRILDAGCGPGRLTLPAARRVGDAGHVVALDVQSKMLERLRHRLEREKLGNVEPLLAGLGDGGLPVDTFDVAFLVTVLGEVPDKVTALREIHASLRPGAVLSVTEVLPDPHYQTVRRLRALAEQTGFEEQRLFQGRLAYTLNLVKPRPVDR